MQQYQFGGCVAETKSTPVDCHSLTNFARIRKPTFGFQIAEKIGRTNLLRTWARLGNNAPVTRHHVDTQTLMIDLHVARLFSSNQVIIRKNPMTSPNASAAVTGNSATRPPICRM